LPLVKLVTALNGIQNILVSSEPPDFDQILEHKTSMKVINKLVCAVSSIKPSTALLLTIQNKPEVGSSCLKPLIIFKSYASRSE